MIRFIEQSGAYSTKLTGGTVTQVRLDHGLGWTITDDDLERLVISVGGVFWLTGLREGSVTRIDPGVATSDLGAVAVGTRLAQVEACGIAGGALELRFSGGMEVNVEPSEDFEAWELEVLNSGAYRFKAVCTPGGEVAIWK